MIKSGDADHNQRWVLAMYLKWVGFDKEKVIEFFAKHAKDYNERITRYQVEHIYAMRGSRKDYLMPSCRWMREHNMCLECGWDRNPVTYTYARAQVPDEVRERFFSEARRSKKEVIAR